MMMMNMMILLFRVACSGKEGQITHFCFVVSEESLPGAHLVNREEVVRFPFWIPTRGCILQCNAREPRMILVNLSF